MPLLRRAVLEGHKSRVWHVSWHPTLPLLASCSEDKSIKIWSPVPSADVPAPKLFSSIWHSVAELDGFSTRTVRCCEWSPCGRLLAATSFDGNTTIWRVGGRALANGALSWVLNAGGVGAGDLSFEVLVSLDGHESEVKGVAWSPSGELLATSGRDKSVWLWEAVEEGSDFECIAVLHGHEQDVKSVTWHPNRDILVSCSYDDSIKAWGEAADDWLAYQSIASSHTSTVWSTAWHSKGRCLASVGDDGALRLWTANPQVLGSSGTGVDGALHLSRSAEVLDAHSRTAFSVHWAGPCVGGDGIIATCGADDSIRLFKVDGELSEGGAINITHLPSQPHAHSGDINSIRWHGTLPLLASAGDDCLVKLWEFT